MFECSVIAKAKVEVPKEALLKVVLRANGFNGLVGINFLLDHYGHVLSNGRSEVLAFIGVHANSGNHLLSRRRLWWNHYISHNPMAAGFFRREGMAEYDRFQKLKCQLGLHNWPDVIGCIAHYADRRTDLERTALAPEVFSWLGVCEQGWLAIDPCYFLAVIYRSLSDLLDEQGGIEIIAEV
ncbi:MAG: hypothetical protein U0996_10710 [Planctomycetaceae bacterium]